MQQEIEKLNDQIGTLEMDNARLKADNVELTEKNESLTRELAEVFKLGDAEKKEMLAKILKDNPGVCGELIKEKAFNEGSE